jgi:molybdenum cofactor guanylyltransferase
MLCKTVKYPNLSAIILAGGKSTRMGQDKALLKVDGDPMIVHIATKLKELFGEIIIGSNNQKHFELTQCRVIPDEIEDRGPLMGIFSCLKASSNNINFVMACDIPSINVKLVGEMIELSNHYVVVMPISGKEKLEPLFAVYNKSIIPKIEYVLSNGGSKIIDILPGLNVKFIELGEKNIANLNYPDDYNNFLSTQE